MMNHFVTPKGNIPRGNGFGNHSLCANIRLWAYFYISSYKCFKSNKTIISNDYRRFRLCSMIPRLRGIILLMNYCTKNSATISNNSSFTNQPSNYTVPAYPAVTANCCSVNDNCIFSDNNTAFYIAKRINNYFMWLSL